MQKAKDGRAWATALGAMKLRGGERVDPKQMFPYLKEPEVEMEPEDSISMLDAMIGGAASTTEAEEVSDGGS